MRRGVNGDILSVLEIGEGVDDSSEHREDMNNDESGKKSDSRRRLYSSDGPVSVERSRR